MTVVPPPRAASHRPVVAAWAAGVLAVVGLAWTVVTDPWLAFNGHVWEDAATAVMWAVLGGILARHRHGRAAWLFLVVACSGAAAVAGGAYAIAGPPAAVATAWFSGWIWAVSTFVPVTLLPVVLASDRSRSHRPVVALSVAAIGTTCAGLATSTQVDVTPGRSVANPVAADLSGLLFVAGSVLVVATSLLAIGTLWRQLLASSGLARRQLAPVALAASVTLPALVVGGVAGNDWSAAIQLVVGPLVPAAVTLAILQYRLYEVELVLRRSMVFLGLTAIVIGGYLLVVEATANLLHRQAGTAESVLAATAIALVFAPARAGLQTLVGRWLYGDRRTPDRALADVGIMLSVAPGATAALESAIARLRDALRLPWVAVRCGDEVVAEAGSMPRWAAQSTDTLVESHPLLHLDTVQGEVRLVPRSPHDPLDDRDRLLLGQLLALVAAILATHRLITDVQLSREQAVLAREEERRRIRRDLHDGIGPLLSALGTHADVGVLRLRRDPSAVPEVLERIRELADDAVAGLRRVVDDLQPPSLDELGLEAALEQLVATLSAGVPQIRIEGQAGSGLPAAVEVATYRVVAEALTNALRHSGAGAVDVRLARSPDRLDVAIADDGVGIAPTASVGVGLASMRDRAAELGATFAVDTSPAGTVVRARFPLRSD